METPKLFIRTVVKKQHSIGNWGYSAAQAVEKRHEGERYSRSWWGQFFPVCPHKKILKKRVGFLLHFSKTTFSMLHTVYDSFG
jgi:hypothetical protein